MTPEEILNVEHEIVLTLKNIYDPEIPVNIYDLGLIYEIEFDPEGVANIRMTLTAPNCPMADMLLEDICTEHSVSYTFTLIETRNADALKLMFGEENVTVSAGNISVDIKAGMVPRAGFVFDMADEQAVRVVVKDGQPSLSGDVNFVDEDVISYPITVEAFPDEDGVKSTLMMETPVEGE